MTNARIVVIAGMIALIGAAAPTCVSHVRSKGYSGKQDRSMGVAEGVELQNI